MSFIASPVHAGDASLAQRTEACSRRARVLGLAVWIGLSALVSALVPVPRLAAQSAETTGSVAVVAGARAVRAHTSPPIVATEVTDLTVSRTRTSTEEFEFFVDTLIGSLQFGSFGIGQALGDPAMGGLLLPLDLPTPFSIGEPAGTNPSEGLLFWSGSAFARDVSGTETNGHVVIGEVEVSIASYADPRANVSFFDLFDLNTGASKEDFGWTDVPVQDGTFNAGSLWSSQASDPATGVPAQAGAFGAGTQGEAGKGLRPKPHRRRRHLSERWPDRRVRSPARASRSAHGRRCSTRAAVGPSPRGDTAVRGRIGRTANSARTNGWGIERIRFAPN